MKTVHIVVVLVFLLLLVLMVDLMLPWLFPVPSPEAFAAALGVPS